MCLSTLVSLCRHVYVSHPIITVFCLLLHMFLWESNHKHDVVKKHTVSLRSDVQMDIGQCLHPMMCGSTGVPNYLFLNLLIDSLNLTLIRLKSFIMS